MLDKKIFAERLKAKRHEKLLSQKQLAKIIHVTSSAISNYEREAVFS
jgi:transcriptional regulator with XRE-family HTH domain